MSEIKWNDNQRKILENLEGNIVASASAGSGKTAVMLERVIRLLEQNIPLENILVLAYNESIATEIKAKLKERLEKDVFSRADNYMFLSEQLDKLDSANILTIDAYCGRLIREYFEQLDIDPRFVIMSDIEQKSTLNGIIGDVTQAIKNDKGSLIFELILMFGGEKGLNDVVAEIISYLSVLPEREEWLTGTITSLENVDVDNLSILSDYHELFARRARYVSKVCENVIMELAPDDRRIIALKGYVDGLNFATHAVGYREFRRSVVAFDIPTKARTRKNESSTEQAIEDYDYAHAMVKKFINDEKEKLSTPFEEVVELRGRALPALECLANIVKKVIDKYSAVKQKSGRFDFSDLTYYAIKLLRDDDISADIKARYKSVCVDEFQDANFCQEYILSRIVNENLFVVGDTKQCIYKFRLAEPKILQGKFADMASDTTSGLAIRLNDNYRSDERVLEFVNRIFNKIMTRELCGVDYERDEQLKAGMPYEHKSEVDTSCEIALFIGEDTKESQEYDFSIDIYDIRVARRGKVAPSRVIQEGNFIAEKIKSLVGVEDIYDPKAKAWRKVNYDDITLLARNRSQNVATILDTISRAGVPIDRDTLDNERGDSNIDIIIAMLQVIDNDRQDLPLAIALNSAWGGMSYQELAELREKDNKSEFFYMACLSQRKQVAKLDRFYTLLDSARAMLATKTLGFVARYLVYECGFYNALGLGQNGDADKFVVKQFLDNMADTQLSLSEYLRGVEGLERTKYEQYVPSMSTKSVKASTIHGSKGLEYPIVFLIDCACSIRRENGESVSNKIILDRNCGIAIQDYDKDNLIKKNSLFMNIAKEFKRNDELMEAMRVFYVALTRARNLLFITGNMKKERLSSTPFDVNSFAEWLITVAHSDSEIAGRLHYYECETQSVDLHEEENVHLFDSEIREYPTIDSYVNFVYPHQKVLDLGIKYTVTEINELDVYGDALTIDKQSGESDDNIAIPQDRTANKAQRGTNYHKILEHIDYNACDNESVTLELRRMVAENILAEQDLSEIKVTEITEILRSDIMRYAANNNCLREQKFMLLAPASATLGGDYADEEILVQGAIDLVILGDTLCVVDFKKSSRSEADIIKTYHKQLDLYARAVEEALARKVDKKIIYQIGANRTILID